jgi:hypothetical protein
MMVVSIAIIKMFLILKMVKGMHILVAAAVIQVIGFWV